MCSEDSIHNYLVELSSRSPTPGGGSVAALAGAMGASLLCMTANFTIGKEKYKTVENQMKDILRHSEELRERFNKSCAEDAKAYKKLSDAFKLPKDTSAKSQDRERKIQDALREATAVPLEVCKYTHEAIELCLPLAKKGNTNLITDVGIASIMFDSAFKSALLNVEINLKSIKDNKFILEIRKILESLQEKVVTVNKHVSKEVENALKTK